MKKQKSLYEKFRERTATRARRIPRSMVEPRGNALAVLGEVDSISYRTTVGKEARRYKHTFSRGSRPLFATEGKRVYLVGGRYHVTERGIVDLSPRGREKE